MSISGGLDLHRSQITYDYADSTTGEIRTGRIEPATRESFASFLADLDTRDADFVVEGCTGWWFVADELTQAGMTAHVADPAEAAALRGRKKRAKTDRADARHLRELLATDRVPESWVPPAHVIETRSLGRLYLDLLAARNSWAQRIHATLYHHGLPEVGRTLTSTARQQTVEQLATSLDETNQWAINVALSHINNLTADLKITHRRLCWIGRHQPGTRAIQAIYGIGQLTAPVIWAELGDTRRFNSSKQTVRHAGIDITVYDSNDKRAPGRLSRQGPPALRWALYEAAQTASHRRSPDHAYYTEVRNRRNHKIATISVARKLIRRCHHILNRLGDESMTAPTPNRTTPPLTRT